MHKFRPASFTYHIGFSRYFLLLCLSLPEKHALAIRSTTPPPATCRTKLHSDVAMLKYLEGNTGVHRVVRLVTSSPVVVEPEFESPKSHTNYFLGTSAADSARGAVTKPEKLYSYGSLRAECNKPYKYKVRTGDRWHDAL